MRIRTTVAVAAAGVLLAGLTACGGGESSANPGSAEDPITFGVGAPVLIDSTAPYGSIPKAMGYWKDQGLNVKIQPTQGATASVQLLLAGKADIINGGTSAFYQAAAQSPNIRVVTLQAHNIWNIAVPEDSPIKAIGSLKGKTIGVQSLSSASYLFGRAAVEASGLDPEKDVKWLAVGVGSQAAQAVKDGTVAAYATYDGPSGTVGSLLGKKMVNLPTPLDKVAGLSGIATTEEFLSEHRDVVTKFLLGHTKGTIFAGANPEAALQIQWAEYPEQKPKGKSTEDALKAALPGVESRYVGSAKPGPFGLIGDVPMDQAQASIDFMVKYGILKKPLDAKEFVDLSVVKDANKFDAEAVEKQAEDWKP